MRVLRTLLTSDDHHIVFIRFAAVGGAFTLIYMLLAMLFSLGFGIAPAIANFTAHILCIPPTYLSQRALAFRSDAPHARAFWRYVALQAPLLVMSTSVAWLLIGQMGLHPVFAFIVIGCLIAVASFLMQRLWAFARNREPQ